MSMLRAAFDIEVGRRLDGSVPASRDAAELARLRAENDILREELRLLRSRFGRLKGPNRPRYTGPERLEILELKARCGWTARETVRRFLLDEETVTEWMSKVREEGEDALLRAEPPVNKFPDLVDRIIARACGALPLPSKRKIATFLARVGLHVSPTTVWRRLKRPDATGPAPATAAESPSDTSGVPPRTVTAKYPGHVWNVDLTVAPTGGGFWSALGQVFPQVWPFAWWVAVAEDHFSRRVQGFASFYSQPSARDVCAFLARAIRQVGEAPQYVICDRGPQFDCDEFRTWLARPHGPEGRRHTIRPRFGAVGKYGSIAVIERFIRSLKDEWLRRMSIPLRKRDFDREVQVYLDWHAEHRPNMSLGGRTPNEVYSDRPPANEAPRLETRLKYPPDAWVASPQASVKGRRGGATGHRGHRVPREALPARRRAQVGRVSAVLSFFRLQGRPRPRGYYACHAPPCPPRILQPAVLASRWPRESVDQHSPPGLPPHLPRPRPRRHRPPPRRDRPRRALRDQ